MSAPPQQPDCDVESPAQTPLLTFAVVSDTHVKLERDDPSSPYRCNERAIGRTRYAVRELARLRPRFVVHLGDLVQAVPGFPSHQPAMAEAHRLLTALPCELHVAPGNHDIGDKPVSWAPAPAVDGAHIRRFDRFWGRSYSSFDHADCHFVLLNSPVLNSGSPAEAEQRRWLERDLKSHRTKRQFLFTHYPPYVADPGEEEHYDNVGEPARGWLLGLADECGVEAIFAGHVHHFFYNRYGPTNCYVVPSTAFTRQDYSEFFRVAPLAEGGRDDVPKMGFLVVDVLEDGHRIRFQSTAGRTLATLPKNLAGGKAAIPPVARHATAPVGVYLRHAWDEVTLLPHAGPLDEFTRKAVRNDYPLLMLWSAGIRDLRVPVADLLSDRTRERMQALTHHGFRFTVFTLGAPSEATGHALIQHRQMVTAWEVIASPDDLPACAHLVRQIKREGAIRVHLSVLETSAQRVAGERLGGHFHHVVRHGLVAGDLERYHEPLQEWLAPRGGMPLVDRLVFRIGPSQSPAPGIQAAQKAAERVGVKAVAHVQLQASDSPAAEQRDDVALAYRVAETVLAAHTLSSVDVLLDTFVDQDRGYFVRNGLIDRRHNPRPAYHVLRHLSAFLSEMPSNLQIEEVETPTGAHVDRTIALRTDGALRALLCLAGQRQIDSLVLPVVPGLDGESGEARCLDLTRGTTTKVAWRKERRGVSAPIIVAGAPKREGATLLLPHAGKPPRA